MKIVSLGWGEIRFLKSAKSPFECYETQVVQKTANRRYHIQHWLNLPDGFQGLSDSRIGKTSPRSA